MEGHLRPAWFVGDLGDPWVVALGNRLPESFERRPCTAEMPEEWLGEASTPRVVVVHRPILTPLDAERIAGLRDRGETPARVVLCFGPHVRHDDLVRWSRLFDATLPEATAAETIRRVVEPLPRSTAPRPPVQVVSGLHDMRSLLVEVCRFAGYRVERQGEKTEPLPNGVTLCDIPVLEPGWPEALAHDARASSVIALFSFPDRSTISLAREAGASACLEWPCDVDELISVMDRVSARLRMPQVEAGHLLPPSPVRVRRLGRHEVVDPKRTA